MKYLYFNAYFAGLSNCKLALDIGVGLAHLTRRVLVIYNNRPIARGSSAAGVDERTAGKQPTVIDLYDCPVERIDEEEFANLPRGLTGYELPMEAMTQSLFYFPNDLEINDSRFNDFRNGRKHAFTVTPDMDRADVICVTGKTLGQYSYSFYLAEENRKDLVRIMKAVTPKRAYQKFADELSAHLGRFNALHIRRGDFLDWSSAPRAAAVSAQEILDNIRQILPTDEPLAICTDESWNGDYFRPILDAYKRAFFIDRFILGEKYWSGYFQALPHHDEVVLALLSQLTASSASNFVGTLCSTFTGLIHRARGFNLAEERFFFAYNQFNDGPLFRNCEFIPMHQGHFSWNRYGYPIAPNAFSWFREWPEAFR